MSFMKNIQEVLNERIVYTENGAEGYETTGKKLLDMNFSVASLRNEEESVMIDKFIGAFIEDRLLAMKWLFYMRDIRGGLGERNTFRVIMKYLAFAYTDMVEALCKVIAEYGRYDDLLCLIDTPVEETVLTYIASQLAEDIEGMKENEGISLCAKWMPGNNTSSFESRRIAAKIQKCMGLTAKQYRKMLAELRAYIGVIEVYMSDNRWDEIEYSYVPSKANVLYREAFLRHDKERRNEFLEKAVNGEAFMNADVLMPHDIVAQYTNYEHWSMNVKSLDKSLEVLWKNLPDAVVGAKDVLCVVDSSGSMLVPVGKSKITALHVSNALGIYFAERLRGEYKNKFITFSSKPKYVDLSSCRNLREKLELAFSHSDCSNTNIEATFDLILETAVRKKLRQSKLPKTVLIISDMEFDQATYGINHEVLFENIKRKFSRYGYKMPKLVFWNVNSRTSAIPLKENALGVTLVSGFSVNVCNMVLTNELDPYKALKKTLESSRYKVIEKFVS